MRKIITNFTNYGRFSPRQLRNTIDGAQSDHEKILTCLLTTKTVYSARVGTDVQVTKTNQVWCNAESGGSGRPAETQIENSYQILKK